MYRLIRRIDNVKSKFQVFMSGVICQIEILVEERPPGMEDDIFREKHLITDDKIIVLNDTDISYGAEVIEDKVFIGAYNNSNNIVFNLQGDVIFIKQDSEGCYFYEIYGDQKGIDKKYLLRTFKADINNKNFDVIDRDMNVILHLDHPVWWGAVVMFDEYFVICQTQKSFTTYHFPTKTRLWDCDISHFGKYMYYASERETKVSYFLGYYGQSIYVLLTNETLIEVDIHTGKITHQWEEMRSCVFDKNRGRIVGFKLLSSGRDLLNKRYTVNLDTKEQHVDDISEYFIGLDIRELEINRETPIIGEHMFCVFRTRKTPMDWNYGPKSGLMAYNLQTDKVDWQYFVEEGTFASYPKVAGDRIYILNGSLHELWIFEKSKT